MSPLPLSIPRAADAQELYQQPFDFLARTRAKLGDVFVIREDGPLLSRATDCNGAIAVFGHAHNRAVLSDIDLFGMPVSAAQGLSLPPTLANLNRSLQSMRGKQHYEHQRLLARVLGERSIEDQDSALGIGLETFVQSWKPGLNVGLLSEMRRLALEMSTRLLFGDEYRESSELASLIQAYFHFRREASSPFAGASKLAGEDLVALGTSLDDALRRHIGWSRQTAITSSGGILTKLASLELDSGKQLSDDELVAHNNILFVSCTEPVAVALTWILLILTQLPDLRCSLRHELEQVSDCEAMPRSGQLARMTLLAAVINESLRLLPPNALMVRLTTEPASLNGVLLPERCELILCPFLAHRDPDRFPRPNEFLPSRWSEIKPSPFEYFPFGAGGHACVGRHFATYIIKTTLASLLSRYDLVLANDQEIDWRLHIQFMPRNDPIITVQASSASSSRAGKLLGPINELIKLHTHKS